ncbi:MAG: tetratricopeptide repeat protein [Gammaproteobacteria bacterium]|nr:tetratricopeptide repeat protein [Gammaproteobacteria bacterium]
MPKARLGSGLAACLLLSACANTTPVPPPTPPTPLDGKNLTHMLAGEISLHRGLNQQASEHFLASAQSTQNAELAKRATYAAQLSNQTDNYKQASQMWAQLQPEVTLAQQHVAQSLLRNNEIDAAKDVLMELIDTKPEYLPAPTLYAEILLAEQAYQQADTFLQPYTNQAQPDRLLASMHVQALSQLSDPEGALELLNKLIKRYANDAGLRLSAGVLYMQVGLLNQAQTHLLKAAKLDPDNSQAQYYLGLNYLQLSQPNKALKHLRLVSAGPNLIPSMLEQIAIEQPAAQHTRDYFAKLRGHHPQHSAQLYLLQADYFKSLSELQLAQDTYREGLDKHPLNIPLLYSQAMLAAYQGDWIKMESDLLKVIELNPDHADALNALGYTYADHNSNLKQADIYIKRAFQLKPDDPAIKDSMGWLAFRQGHYRLARDYLRQAFAEFPDAEVAAHLGVVEWALGNIEQAHRIWNSILKDDPDNALIKQAQLDAQKEFPNEE